MQDRVDAAFSFSFKIQTKMSENICLLFLYSNLKGSYLSENEKKNSGYVLTQFNNWKLFMRINILILWFNITYKLILSHI